MGTEPCGGMADYLTCMRCSPATRQAGSQPAGGVKMRVHLLGSVELSVNTEQLAIPSDKRRQLLAALALEVGRPLSHTSLADRLWDDEPPPSALASLYSHISHLRALLRRATRFAGGQSPSDAPAIDTRSHTYTLRADPQLIDWHQYLDLTRQARLLAENGQDHQARTVLNRTEELWCGEPLAGLPGTWAQTARTAMADQHFTTTLLRVEVDLRLGRHHELIPELTALREDRPTDERLAGHLMTALHAAGRQAEALAVYPAVVRLLHAHFATEPGGPLTRLHQRMLRGEPLPGERGRAVITPPPSLAPAPRATPPARVPGRHRMVGREEDLRRVLPRPHDRLAHGGVVTVSAILGMPGVGKTTLALHAADLMCEYFPDGYVYLNLRAHVGNQPPLTPQAAGALLLRRLGVPATTIPLDAEEVFALCVEALSSRRAVVILDDASNATQVRPLLPPAPTALVIITSRQRLTDLPDAKTVFLDVLTVDDAVALFLNVVGPERAVEREHIIEIVKLCGLLPLAIALAASRFKARPSWTLPHLARRLARKNGRLAEFRNGSESIARVFELSYRYLPPSERSAFRLLGLHPGPDFGLHAAAALLGRPVDVTDRILEALLNCHLIQEISPERYQFHDLIREFATALDPGEEQRAAAVNRLFRYALHAADAADRILYPRRSRLPVPEPVGGPDLADLLTDLALDSRESVKAWLTAERPGLLALVANSGELGFPESGAWISHVLAGHLEAEAYWSDAHDMHRTAAAHWRSVENDRCEARALIDLGATLANASRYPSAVEALSHGLDLARAEDDRDAVANALGILGLARWHQGALSEALAHQEEALGIRRETGDHWNAARCLANVGIVHSSLGNAESALSAYSNALPLARDFNDRPFELRILNNIGDLHLGARNLLAARSAFELVLSLGSGHLPQFDLAIVKINLAASLSIPGELDRALELYGSALTTFRESGGVRTEVNALIALADTLRAAGRHTDARDQYTTALGLARSVGTTREQAIALRGLGLCSDALGLPDEAAEHLATAAHLAERIHAVEEATRAREALAEIRDRQDRCSS
ncbi:BTAD domain-containing putative transcriptional regulator [Kitasatospora sp. NPDC006786]